MGNTRLTTNRLELTNRILIWKVLEEVLNREGNTSENLSRRGIRDFQGLPFNVVLIRLNQLQLSWRLQFHRNLSCFFFFVSQCLSSLQKNGFPLKAGGSPVILSGSGAHESNDSSNTGDMGFVFVVIHSF